MKDFCLLHETESLNIDDRKFITFGLVNGFIRRVHKYPVRTIPGNLKTDTGELMPGKGNIAETSEIGVLVPAESHLESTSPVLAGEFSYTTKFRISCSLMRYA